MLDLTRFHLRKRSASFSLPGTGFSGFPAKTLFSSLCSSPHKHRAGHSVSPFCRAGAEGSTRTCVRAPQALFVFCLHASPEEDKCLMNNMLGVKMADVFKLHR